MSNERDEHRFLVRLWRELGADSAAWRGSIEHLPTGARHYFTGLAALAEYLDAHVSNQAGSGLRRG